MPAPKPIGYQTPLNRPCLVCECSACKCEAPGVPKSVLAPGSNWPRRDLKLPKKPKPRIDPVTGRARVEKA